MTIFVDFEPVGRRGECEAGLSLLEAARELGVMLVNICGGNGKCGNCIVQLIQGELSPITESEHARLNKQQLAEGYRLACCAIPLTDCKVCIPPDSLSTPQRTQIEGQSIRITADPIVRSHFIRLTPPDLDDLKSDTDRLITALPAAISGNEYSCDYALLRELSTLLRSNDWHMQAIERAGEVIALLPEEMRVLGVAVDIGTTKIAVYLMDLYSGETMAATGLMNPQIAYGEDIITRMAATQQNPQAAQTLQHVVVEALSTAFHQLCQECGQLVEQIVEVVVVGNTAMHHLFTGLPVRQLGRAPHVPAVSGALDLKAHALGLRTNAGAYVHLLPNIAGYVGADHVSMLLAVAIHEQQGCILAVDIGTNTEICLANNGRLSSLSTASGPAFEGAHIKHGMRAASGAIEHFRIDNDGIKIQTIDNIAPVGLCGSGILDVLAQLHQSGIINRRGKLLAHPRVRDQGAASEFIIVPADSEDTHSREITFTQADIEQLLLAKGAIRTGINVLLDQQNLNTYEIDQVLIAGAFGSYLDVRSAIAVGLLPDIPLDRIQQVGNAAGMGAKLALISQAKRHQAGELATKIEYIELASDPHFMRTFANAMYLPGE